jgi:hypothetical protein
MAVPDGLIYLKHELNSFTRQSEYEPIPAYYENAQGVWLDEFHRHWISNEKIIEHVQKKKKVCIVSPDLHQRDYISEWNDYYKLISDSLTESIILCTDYPDKAKSFFYE